MKAAALVVAIALTQAGLASAIPQNNHKHLHKARTVVPVTETLTATVYQTIVWVEADGVPVSTQTNDPPTDTTITPDVSTSSINAPASTPIVSETTKTPVAGQLQISRKEPLSSASLTSPTTIDPLPASPISDAPSSLTPSPPDQSSVMVKSYSNPSPETTAVSEPAATSTPPSKVATSTSGMGVCYELINSNSQCKSATVMSSEFSFLRSQGFSLVRTYDIGCDLGAVRTTAQAAGLGLVVGINSIANLQADVAKLVSWFSGNWAGVDTVYIGNELVNNGQASADAVAAAVTVARGILRGAGYNANVVTVDTFAVMQQNPTICSTSDYCAANAHAFFDPNTDASAAGQFVLDAYNKIKAANGGKRTIITESGWPYAGSCNGKACPGVAQQKTAINSIMSSFTSSGNAGNVFLFMAYNAGYKAPGQFGVEPYFGIFDQDHYTGGIGAS